MRKSVLAAAAACCVLIGTSVNAGQIKFDPGMFKIYGGMTSGQTASLYTPQETPGTSRRIVDFYEPMAAGSILIRTAERRLYYVLPNNKAIMYPVGVGREGFTWSGQDVDYPQGNLARLAPAEGDDRARSQKGPLHSGLHAGRS